VEERAKDSGYGLVLKKLFCTFYGLIFIKFKIKRFRKSRLRQYEL